MSSTEWREKAFDENFERAYANLVHRKKNHKDFSLQEAEGVLKHLYVMEGNDQLGRGDLGDVVVHAQIAAHEAFIHEWKAELAGLKKDSSTAEDKPE